MDDETFIKHIDEFAYQINQGTVRLVRHIPESEAKSLSCYENVRRKVKKSGGMLACGWTFLSKRSVKGDYLIAQHHAVWGIQGSEPIDITPYLDGHTPLMISESILFLLDMASAPKIVNGSFAPTPSRFYPITKSSEMDAYIKELEVKEQAECHESYTQLKGA